MNSNYTRNQRLWHLHFGPCKVHLGFVASDKIVVDLDAKEISYYVMGKGYKTVKEDSNGNNYLRCPVSELFASEQDVPSDKITALKKVAMNASYVL